MQAVIFNSGLGSRMKSLTSDCHKSMVHLANGETIFERQLRILYECGIRKFIITVGPFAEQLVNASKRYSAKGCTFSFIENPIYRETNYIYSMYLARNLIEQDDILLLHGDIVFNKRYVQKVLASSQKCLGSINAKKSLPQKDFKARIINGYISEVSINIFDDGCVAFQPFYKISQEKIKIWLKRVEDFIANGNDKVYAENAMNEVSSKMEIIPFSYEDDYVDEVDTPEDLQRVSEEIRVFDFDEQPIFIGSDGLQPALELFAGLGVKKPLIVCSKRFLETDFFSIVTRKFPAFSVYDNILSNPEYGNVFNGIETYKNSNCDSVISIGGGSTIDLAKAIKLISEDNNISGEIKNSYGYSHCKHFAIPTTAGTGSESTRYAAIYCSGIKHSVTQDCIVPDCVLLDSYFLLTLPEYQKKCTLLDSLCQAIESYWSVNSTNKSKMFAEQAIKLIIENYGAYLSGEEKAAMNVLIASNLSGKAISISQTTAPHAMSYKLTTEFGLPHGHAVALCLKQIWKYMLAHYDDCSDARGEVYVCSVFDSLGVIFNVDNADKAAEKFDSIVCELGLNEKSIRCDSSKLEELVQSVNQDRLSNNPILIDSDTIRKIYSLILSN